MMNCGVHKKWFVFTPLWVCEEVGEGFVEDSDLTVHAVWDYKEGMEGT